MPLDVHFDTETMDEAQVYVATMAFKLWNDNVGETIFTFPQVSRQEMVRRFDEDEPGQIFVYMRDLETRAYRRGWTQRRKLGECHWIWGRDRMGEPVELRQAHISLHDGMEWEKLIFVVMHEAGHALGLLHDTSLSSIMYPLPLNSDMDIEEQDIEFIRERLRILRRNEILHPLFDLSSFEQPGNAGTDTFTLRIENQNNELPQIR